MLLSGFCNRFHSFTWKCTRILFTLRKHAHAIYRDFFFSYKNRIFDLKFLTFFTGYFYSKHTLWVHVRTTSKIRKLGIPLKRRFFYIKEGFMGVYISWTCSSDVKVNVNVKDFNV